MDYRPPMSLHLGLAFDRTFPASFVLEVASRLDRHDDARLWLIEDCFHTAAQPLAAAALATTTRLNVGLGILPAVARNPAIAAMEIATLAELAPGRIIAGIGHGVQSWMGQMGVRPESPLTTLEEVTVAVKRLLAGEEVTTQGSVVSLDAVKLEAPPSQPVPVISGVRGPKSLALAGRVADGVLLAEPAAPSYVRWAHQHTRVGDRADDDFITAVYSPLCLTDDATQAHQLMAPWVAGQLADPNAGVAALPFAEELQARFADGGDAALVDMPHEWWTEIGPIGTLDDVMGHLGALADAGVDHVGLFPAPDVEVARRQLDQLDTLMAAQP